MIFVTSWSYFWNDNAGKEIGESPFGWVLFWITMNNKGGLHTVIFHKLILQSTESSEDFLLESNLVGHLPGNLNLFHRIFSGRILLVVCTKFSINGRRRTEDRRKRWCKLFSLKLPGQCAFKANKWWNCKQASPIRFVVSY